MIESTTWNYFADASSSRKPASCHGSRPTRPRIATIARGGAAAQIAVSRQVGFVLRGGFLVQPPPPFGFAVLREASLREMHSAIVKTFELRQAAYAAAFIWQATESERRCRPCFELLRGFSRLPLPAETVGA